MNNKKDMRALAKPAVDLDGAVIMRAPPSALTIDQVGAAFSIVKHIAKRLGERQATLREELLRRAPKLGKLVPGTPHRRVVLTGGGAILVEEHRPRSVTKAFETGIKAILGRRNIDLDQVFVVVKTWQLDEEKLEAVIKADNARRAAKAKKPGKKPPGPSIEDEVEALCKISYTVKDEPAPELIRLLSGGERGEGK